MMSMDLFRNPLQTFAFRTGSFPGLILSSFSFLFLFTACSSEQEGASNEVAFYHWKAEAEWTDTIAEALERNEVRTIYMHYFDVDLDEREGKVYPEFVLKEVDRAYQNHRIVPVVFLTERALKNSESVGRLSERIRELVNEIHRHHFDTIPERVQLDCDWTRSTRGKYFDLLKGLGESYEIEVTLRLHQVKYRERTGVPPAERATLMLYNVGELEEFGRNSILDPSIVDPYLSEGTTYPLELDLALPLFGQTIIKDRSGNVRLINEDLGEELEATPSHFEREGEGRYKVLKDTLFKGFYLYEGYRLKPERVEKEDILRSYRMVEKSGLKTERLIFYHLEGSLLQKKSPHSIVEAL